MKVGLLQIHFLRNPSQKTSTNNMNRRGQCAVFGVFLLVFFRLEFRGCFHRQEEGHRTKPSAKRYSSATDRRHARHLQWYFSPRNHRLELAQISIEPSAVATIGKKKQTNPCSLRKSRAVTSRYEVAVCVLQRR